MSLTKREFDSYFQAQAEQDAESQAAQLEAMRWQWETEQAAAPQSNFRITRIKPAFINREILAQVAADALAKLNPHERDGKRWANAIGKAVATIENNPSMIYDLKAAALHIVGSTGAQYTANGVCQCQAFIGGFPCYHRAAARLIQRYLEIVR